MIVFWLMTIGSILSEYAVLLTKRISYHYFIIIKLDVNMV